MQLLLSWHILAVLISTYKALIKSWFFLSCLDFFDSGSKPGSAENNETSTTEVAPVTNKIENLPEGFFDDPIADAKVS